MSGTRVHGFQKDQPGGQVVEDHQWGPPAGTTHSSESQSSTGSHQKILCTERPSVKTLKKFPGKRETFNILERIGTHYRVVGTFILEDIDGSVVTNIADCGRRNPYNISQAIVQRWLETGGERTTFETLVSCLRDAELNTLAKDIEDKVGKNNKDKPTLDGLTKFEGKRETFNVIERIGIDYGDVGMYLLEDDNKEEVAIIEATEGRGHNPVTISEHILQLWLKSAKKGATWTTLVKHLRSADLNTLALDIEEVLKKS